MAGSSQPQHYIAAGCVFGVFVSLVMGPSRIWIFMKINIFLFEHLSRQDFLDPEFSNIYNVGPGPFKVGLSMIFLAVLDPLLWVLPGYGSL